MSGLFLCFSVFYAMVTDYTGIATSILSYDFANTRFITKRLCSKRNNTWPAAAQCYWQYYSIFQLTAKLH